MKGLVKDWERFGKYLGLEVGQDPSAEVRRRLPLVFHSQLLRSAISGAPRSLLPRSESAEPPPVWVTCRRISFAPESSRCATKDSGEVEHCFSRWGASMAHVHLQVGYVAQPC